MSLTATLPESVDTLIATAPSEDTTTNIATTTTECDKLYAELQSIVRSHESATDIPRALLSTEILSWLIRAGTWTFNPVTLHFTDWGAPAVKIALAAILEYEESQISPELIHLMRDRVVPAVFGTTVMDPVQKEIAHILVQCLMRPNALPVTVQPNNISSSSQSRQSAHMGETARKRHRHR